MSIKHKGLKPQSKHKHHTFQRDLTAPTLTLLTIGGIMGSGLFLASGLAIRSAGPVILIFFGVAVVAMYFEITALAEMSVATPSPGSFLVYTEKVLGPGWTFVSGWIFWFSSVLTMSSEVTAAALFTKFWFPGVALWIWSLVYSALIIGVNFLSVRGFGTIEDVMAGVKTLAVALFLAVGIGALLHILPASAHTHLSMNPLIDITAHGGWLPHGWLAAAPTMLLVLFAYAGTGVIGLAAAESKSPARVIPTAVRSTSIIVFVLYLGSIFLILSLMPWNRYVPNVSPFTIALKSVSVPGAAFAMNLVLLFAVLSTMNAALYSNVRVLYRLAKDHQAPPWLGKLNAKGQPAFAILASAGLLAFTIGLAYALPKQAYAYLVTATGFQAMFIWLMVLLTQLKYRPYLQKHHPHHLKYRQLGFPVSTILVMVFVIMAMGFAFLAKGELVGVVVGIGVIGLTWAVWLVFGHRIIRHHGAG